jgi:hypothetical protein
MSKARFDNAWNGEIFGDYTDQEVFKYAETAQLVTGAIHPEPVVLYGWTLSHVLRPLYWAEGDNDGPDWIAVVRLKDGDYGAVTAGCDYTGWG